MPKLGKNGSSRRLGEEATDKLLARAAGGSVAERVELPVELVVRQSTSAPR